MFPQLVRTMILDSNLDPAAFTTSVEEGISNGRSDTNLVFEQFLSLCQQAGPLDCKLAGNGDVTTRVNELLARLRQGPIPAPGAPPLYELRYGDLEVVLYDALVAPAQWPKLADGLNQAADGDGTNLENTFQSASHGSSSALTALTCADQPLQPPGTILNWPQVMQHLTATD